MKGFSLIFIVSFVLVISTTQCTFLQPEQDRIKKIRQDQVNELMRDWEASKDSLHKEQSADTLTLDSLQ